jgi:hypothetical protein
MRQSSWHIDINGVRYAEVMGPDGNAQHDEYSEADQATASYAREQAQRLVSIGLLSEAGSKIQIIKTTTAVVEEYGEDS